MFTHLGIPKVCSHIREVEFDSQCAPSNATSGRLGSELVFGSAPTSALNDRLTLLCSTPCRTTTPYSPSSSTGWRSKVQGPS